MLKYGIPYLAELIGTGLLVLIGLSLVILNFGTGSPVISWLPDPGLRRAITGFLFGTTGALIAISPLGKVSGAHINPIVTAAFVLKGKMSLRHGSGYVLAQLAGAVLGALPLLAWGAMGASVQFGATIPGKGYSDLMALLGEALCSLCLIVALFLFLSSKRWRKFTPLLFPFLYGLLVFLEAPISGTSTNPARSLGPAVVSGDWQGWWIYWLGPSLGMLFGLAVLNIGWLRQLEIEIAKLYHFDIDPYEIFRESLKVIETEIHEEI